MKKGVISVMLCAAMIVSSFTVPVMAEEASGFDWKAYEKEQFPDGPDGLGQKLLIKARARHPEAEGRTE